MPMISPDLIERLTDQTGGRFRLTTLLQKRAREICLGSPMLVRQQADRPHEIALDEASEGKIFLVEGEEEAAE